MVDPGTTTSRLGVCFGGVREIKPYLTGTRMFVAKRQLRPDYAGLSRRIEWCATYS
jgi:hypothetical protein